MITCTRDVLEYELYGESSMQDFKYDCQVIVLEIGFKSYGYYFYRCRRPWPSIIDLQNAYV
jgi:hypothetical protein